jgi:putative transposase
MNFSPENCFHVYNQGNNKCRIFFSSNNYYFFKEKLRRHVLPHADILASCLMPNHFHLLLHLKKEESAKLLGLNKFKKSLSEDIGILLRSYTRAINIQENRSGSLFRKGTKCKQLFTWDNINCTNENYLKTCFDYIHENPVKAGLVFNQEDWKYSSASIYINKCKSNFINTKLAQKFGLVDGISNKCFTSDETLFKHT